MGRNSGEIVYAGDWTEMAHAFNSEIRNRRGRGYYIGGKGAGNIIYSSDSIQPLIQGLQAVTNSRLVNSNGSISGSYYATGYGAGTVIYPLTTHRNTISTLASISYYASAGYCGCYSGCIGLCAGCSGTCTGGCYG